MSRRAARRVTGALPETAVVEDMTVEGCGVATVGGKRVFIGGAIRGETVTFRRTRSLRHYDEASIVAVTEASPERVAPACRYFGVCGGCSLQHLAPEAQLRLKEQALMDSLERIGNVRPVRVLPPASGSPWGYRRRARLAVRYVDAKGRVLVGFSERDSSRITDMLGCETLRPAVAALLEPLSALIGALTLRRRIPQVEVAVGDDAIALVFRVLDDPPQADRDLLCAFGARHGVRILLQRAGPESLETPDGARDAGELWYGIAGTDLRLTFSAGDFIQVNAAMNARLVALALELLAPDRATRVLDLYCGIGNFTLPLARRAAWALGVEGAAGMVERARRNARLNGIDNAEFRVADLAAGGAAQVWRRESFDAVLLDPPRAGAAAVLEDAAATGARRILYVSCHPGTLARDAGTLVNRLGFTLSAAGVLDMFPATSHVESVALFERP